MSDKNKGAAQDHSSEDRMAVLEAKVAVLESALNYAVYGIGNPHPDPRCAVTVTE